MKQHAPIFSIVPDNDRYIRYLGKYPIAILVLDLQKPDEKLEFDRAIETEKIKSKRSTKAFKACFYAKLPVVPKEEIMSILKHASDWYDFTHAFVKVD